jgi:glycosyltransferase involved in cell wall biosynthesis
MPFISIIVPTNRVGGLDLLFDSLKDQTYKDFELIISDGIYKYRKDIVAQKANGIKYKHIEPFNNPFPLNSYCRTVNTGLAYAEGELVLLLSDYSWVYPNWLSKHITLYNSHNNIVISSPHKYLSLPCIHDSVFTTYGPVNMLDTADNIFENSEINGMESYVRDLESGKFSEVMWSLFQDSFSIENLHEDRNPVCPHDIKLSMPTGPIDPTVCFLKNDLIPLRYLLELNGIDEELDGSHGYQDFDISFRLVAKFGVTWHCDNSNVVLIPNPRSVFRMRSRNRSNHSNRAIFERKQLLGFPIPNNWSLLKRRVELGVK